MRFGLSAKILAWAIGLGLAAVLLIGGFNLVSSYFTAKKEIRVTKGQAGAAVDAGAEAMNTVSNVSAADDAADQAGKDGIDAIRNAPEGKRGDAALAASCRLRHNVNKQRCAGLRQADPGEPSSAR